MPQTVRTKYLGTILTTTQGAKSVGEALLGALRHAMFALKKQIRAGNISHPLTAFQLFDALLERLYSLQDSSLHLAFTDHLELMEK